MCFPGTESYKLSKWLLWMDLLCVFSIPFSVDKDGKGKNVMWWVAMKTQVNQIKDVHIWARFCCALGWQGHSLEGCSCLLYRERIQKHVHSHKGIRCLRNKVRKIFFLVNKMKFFSSMYTHTHTPHKRISNYEDGAFPLKKEKTYIYIYLNLTMFWPVRRDCVI